ncbi:hypothetical protein ASG40_17335 [Methylobacterium sp. Leaf399]|uniref:hypothetical protein n=1 Tax=Methylobacterium sp. Leaf399 TaxID=1736364 RepID=UPI0006FBB4E1|nr:hypothetical protein [Methylobacterium sp. Leaf399]KQT17774.1 hypothetical protein ASG40_17335 [Methylobacterium sp. Leaf399]
MAEVHCFTSATFAYLDRARVLAETLRRHHPDWHVTLCLPDEEPPGFAFDPANEPFDRIVRLPELGIPDLAAWRFGHDVVELCTAVKGAMLALLLEEGARKVVYLDPDIALFSSLRPVEALLERHSVVLTPHLLRPEETEQGVLDNEIGALKHGIYNLGFIAVAGTGEGRRFARWWRARLLAFCRDDIPAGLFTDQRWCDHVPALFDGVHILRDEGFNVASWNVAHRRIEVDPDGTIRAAGRPLRFFHFTKLGTAGRLMLERNGGDQPALFELTKWYERRLTCNAVAMLPEGWWAYGSYADGTPIPITHRRLYRERPDLRARFRDPYAAGPHALAQWMGEASGT